MINVENITKYYGDVTAVSGISFSVPRGQILGLIGPNGAGKSTTLRIITGFLAPSAGRVTIGGVDVSEEPIETKNMIGYLPEGNPLYPEMMVCDYLSFIATSRGLSSAAFVPALRRVVSMCRIHDVMQRPIAALSKGYRQRVGLAMTLLDAPPVLILDEPTSGLDPNQIVEMREIIREIGRERTILFSTHILSQAESTCDRIIIINEGRLIADGTPEELKKSEKNRLKVRLRALSNEEVQSGLRDAEGLTLISCETNEEESALVIEGEGDLPARFSPVALRQGWIILEMLQQKESLEEVFRVMTNENRQTARRGGV